MTNKQGERPRSSGVSIVNTGDSDQFIIKPRRDAEFPGMAVYEITRAEFYEYSVGKTIDHIMLSFRPASYGESDEKYVSVLGFRQVGQSLLRHRQGQVARIGNIPAQFIQPDGLVFWSEPGRLLAEPCDCEYCSFTDHAWLEMRRLEVEKGYTPDSDEESDDDSMK